MSNKPHNPHHLVMGELKDYLSGKILPDTHDERLRQKIVKSLVEVCGFDSNQILQRQPVVVRVGSITAQINVDYLIQSQGKTLMMVQYAPGSLVTRRLTNLALSRIIHDYQIPIVVGTNGKDAEILDGKTGRMTGQGLLSLPHSKDLLGTGSLMPDRFGTSIHDLFSPISPGLKDKAMRIVYACMVDGACPCDTDICVGSSLKN